MAVKKETTDFRVGETMPHPDRFSQRHRRLAALGFGLLFASTSVFASSFEDVSSAAGFTPSFSADIPAGGIAVADFDRNGWPDIFVTGFFQPNRLFFNAGDGTFFEIEAINQALAGNRCSVTAAADFDNDGWPDLYVGCRGDANHLFRNLLGTGFADVTPPALQHLPPNTQSQRTDAVAWGDLDGNGLPDLFIGIYPTSNTPDPSDPDNLDRIVLNLGDGQWQNVALGLDPATLARTALAATFTDIDGDGNVDLYVVNDKLHGNSLWRNDGPGCGGWCLTDIGPASGADRPVFGMGIAVGDYNRDGMNDLYFSSINEQVLLRMTSRDPLQFEQAQDTAGVNYASIGWATLLVDFDHDGWEDALLACSGLPGVPDERRDQLYRNMADASFDNITDGSGLDLQLPSMAMALIDYDRDGALDLAIGHWNHGYRLYRNVGATGNWIAFELLGGAGISRDALGTRIEISTAEGTQNRELRAGESRGSSHQPLLHFGLGTATEAQVTVHWPNGTRTDFGTLAAAQYHRLIHDPGVLFESGFEATDPGN